MIKRDGNDMPPIAYPRRTVGTRRRGAQQWAPILSGARGGGGFVLLELIVVLVIVSIITAAVVPLYGASMGEIQRRSTRNQLVSILLHIQERAVSESVEHRFYFQPERGTYWVERQAETPLDVLERVFEPVNEVYGRPAQLPLGYVFADVGRLGEDVEREALFIRCFPNGACDPVTFSVIDTRSNALQFTVEIMGALGQIRTETPK